MGSDALLRGESTLCNALLHETNPHWTITLPTATKLCWGPFGQLDIKDSFTQEESLDTIAFHFSTLRFLSDHDLMTFAHAHPPLTQLHHAIKELSNYNFQWIRELNHEWACQAEINPAKPSAFLSCLFHYNMDTSLVMHYLGRNYTATHHNVDDIVAVCGP